MSGDGESPEELAAWSAGLGADGDKAAAKMQAVQRAKQARKEVAELRQQIAETELQAHKDEAAAGDDESPEALQAWTDGLGDKADKAATSLQARARAKQARKDVEEMKNKLASAENAEVAAAENLMAEIDPDSPEELAKWTASLGADADAAAAKMQAVQRSKQARKEVTALRKQLAEAEQQHATAEDDAESPENLAKWTADLGAEADAAAVKMQARARAKKAKKEVDELRQKLSAAQAVEDAAEAKQEALDDDDPAALAEWAAGLGDKGDKAASLMQARHRGSAARKEVEALKAAREAAIAAGDTDAAGVDPESPEQLAAWAESLGDKGDKAASMMQARHRGTAARREVEALKKAREEAIAGGDASAAAVDPESPEQLAAWADSLGDKGDKAASMMQARHRGTAARREVEALKKAREEAIAAGDTDAAGVDPESPEQLAAWAESLGEKGDKAASMMQARHRGTAARREVEALKKAREEAIAGGDASAAAVDPESPEQLAAWADSLGDKGDKAASMMQARHRGSAARKEVEALKKARADAIASGDTAAGAVDPDSPEALAEWAAGLGADGNAAALALQTRQRAKQAKKEVDTLRAQLMEKEKAAADAVDPEESPEALAAWTAGLGDDADKAAARMQAVQRAKMAKREVAELREQLAAAAVEESKAAAAEEDIPSDDSPEALAAWASSLGDKGNAAATKMQAKQRQKQAKQEVEKRKQARAGNAAPYERPGDNIPEPPTPELQRILEKSSSSGPRFEDPRLPKRESSVWFCENSFIQKGGSESSWVQPEPTKKMFPEGKPVADLKSHVLSSKYLMAAISFAATRPELLQRIFGSEFNLQWQSSGLVVLQVYRNFEWQNVTLDCNFPGEVLDSNTELWGAFLEKLFAKEYGCYESSQMFFDNGGMQAFETALLMLSGGCLENRREKPEWASLQQKFLSGSLVTVLSTAKSEKLGLLPESPYLIVDMVESHSFQLVRLRNPYGAEYNWNGTIAWGKKTDVRDRIGAHQDMGDGTFWMPWKEFEKAFGDFQTLCRLFKADYHQYALCASWDDSKGQAPTDPDFVSNPQYKITITKPTTLFVSLTQHASSPQNQIQMIMYKAKGMPVLWEFPDGEIAAVGKTLHSEVNFEATIDPAALGCSQFILIPFQATAKPEAGKQFCLRFFADNEIGIDLVPKLYRTVFSVEFKDSNSGGRRQKKDAETGAITDNPGWGRNPQLVLAFNKQTTVKVVVERIVGRKKPVGEIGATLCRLVPASQPDKSLGRVKKGLLPDESQNAKGMNELDETFLKRKLQIMPNDWMKEAPFSEDKTCAIAQSAPVAGPLCIVPSLSEEGLVGNATVTVYSDREIYKQCRLADQQHPLITSEWTADSAGGSHLYYPPYEPPKTSSWGKNPAVYMRLLNDSKNVTIFLARCEKTWRQKIAKDAVGCMLGFYVMRLQFDQHKQIVISRDLVVYETTFAASHEIALDVPLPAGNYLILPCTYDPNKTGPFLVYATTMDAMVELSNTPPMLEEEPPLEN
ncbi:unnamed protein product [Amoebophrya sp. A25]|nr:unnamed protein product [Amoebophrya sp. A25]|eukprot:GSA25T00003977001.1